MEIKQLLPAKSHKLVGQLIRFGISTGFSASCSILIPVGLHEGFKINERIAVAIGFATAYLGNMLLMRIFVFKSSNSWKHDVTRYIVTNGTFRLAEYVVFLALLAWTPLSYITALLTILTTSAAIKFFAYQRLFSG